MYTWRVAKSMSDKTSGPIVVPIQEARLRRAFRDRGDTGTRTEIIAQAIAERNPGRDIIVLLARDDDRPATTARVGVIA